MVAGCVLECEMRYRESATIFKIKIQYYAVSCAICLGTLVSASEH